MFRQPFFVALLFVVSVAGFIVQYAVSNSNTQKRTGDIKQIETNVVGQFRPEFALKDQQGRLRNISEWNGKVLLVNFWASWCAPCKKEIPGFIALQEQYQKEGLQIIGVAVDVEQSVKKYSASMGINYPVMAAEIAAAEIARRYGNVHTVLPFTAIVGRDGKIVLTKAGEMSRQEVEKIIQPLL